MATLKQVRAEVEQAVAPVLAGLPHRVFARRNRSRAYLDEFEAVVWWREDGVRYGCHLGIGWDNFCGDGADLEILKDAAWCFAQEIAEYKKKPPRLREPGRGAGED